MIKNFQANPRIAHLRLTMILILTCQAMVNAQNNALTKWQTAKALEAQRLNEININAKQQIAELMILAKESRSKNDYEHAAIIIDRVLEIKPRHHQAKRQKDQLKDLIFFKKQLLIARNADSKTSRIIMNVDRSAIPPSKRYNFPNNWPEKTARRASKHLSTNNKILNRRASLRSSAKPLSDMMIFSYSDQSLEDVIDDIRTRSGLNIITMWNDLKTINISKDTNVKVELKNTSYGTTLKTVLNYVSNSNGKRVGYEIDKHGIVTIKVVSDDYQNKLESYYIADLVQSQPRVQMGRFGTGREMGALVGNGSYNNDMRQNDGYDKYETNRHFSNLGTGKNNSNIYNYSQ